MLTIRQAKHEDIAQMIALEMVVIDDMDLPLVRKIGRHAAQNLLESAAIADIDERYSYTNAVVADVDGQVVGVAFGYPNESEQTIDKTLQALIKSKYDLDDLFFADGEVMGEEWYLDSLVVDENYRGQGIGQKLLTALPTVAKRFNKPRIGLNVDATNQKAQKLYEKVGFKPIGDMHIGSHRYTHMAWTVSN